MYKININNETLMTVNSIYQYEDKIFYTYPELFNSNRTITIEELNLETINFIIVDGDLFYTRGEGLVYNPPIRKPHGYDIFNEARRQPTYTTFQRPLRQRRY